MGSRFVCRRPGGRRGVGRDRGSTEKGGPRVLAWRVWWDERDGAFNVWRLWPCIEGPSRMKVLSVPSRPSAALGQANAHRDRDASRDPCRASRSKDLRAKAIGPCLFRSRGRARGWILGYGRRRTPGASPRPGTRTTCRSEGAAPEATSGRSGPTFSRASSRSYSSWPTSWTPTRFAGSGATNTQTGCKSARGGPLRECFRKGFDKGEGSHCHNYVTTEKAYAMMNNRNTGTCLMH